MSPKASFSTSRIVCRVVLLTTLCVAATVHAQKIRPVADGDLNLRIIPAQTGLHGTDSLLAKVEVTNVGKDVIVLRTEDLCLNPGSGLTMQVTDASGHRLKSTTPLSCVPVSNTADGDGFVHLVPDSFYGRMIHIQASRIPQKPGQYQLTFTLRGTMSRSDFARVFSNAKTPITAFTSDSQPLVFQLPIQIVR